jgi:hypothetical protein
MLQTIKATTTTVIEEAVENPFIPLTQMLMAQDHNIESIPTTGSMLKLTSEKEEIDLLLLF